MHSITYYRRCHGHEAEAAERAADETRVSVLRVLADLSAALMEAPLSLVDG